MPPSDQAVELSPNEIAGIRTQIDFCHAQHDHVPRRDLCPLDAHLAVRQLLATVDQREQRIEDLENTLRQYGEHLRADRGSEHTCAIVLATTDDWDRRDVKCDCGLDAAIEGGPDAPA